MDINAILPILMNRAGGSGGKNDKINTLLKFAQGEKPDIGTVMNMAMASKNDRRPSGLKPIVKVASYEILGKLAGFFL